MPAEEAQQASGFQFTQPHRPASTFAPLPGVSTSIGRPLERHRTARNQVDQLFNRLSQQELMQRIMAINKDDSLTDAEKGQARQDLMSGKWKEKLAAQEEAEGGKGERWRCVEGDWCAAEPRGARQGGVRGFPPPGAWPLGPTAPHPARLVCFLLAPR